MAESVTVVWSWQRVGLVTLAEGMLVFPRVPNVAGIYRFTFSGPDDQPARAYVGEADPLPRRFQQYRTPGVRQNTNLRLNPALVGALAAGGQVAVDIVTRAQAVVTGGEQTVLDLTWKAARVLVERAAEVAERTAGTPLLNR